MKLFSLLLLLTTFFGLFSSCGKFTKVVTGVTVDQALVNNEAIISIKADLDLGNMSLPINLKQDIELPGKGKVGDVTLNSDKILLNVNMSALVPSMNTEAKLPNGAELPLIGLNPVVVLPVKGSNIEIYISLVSGASAVGVSIPIKELDKIGTYSAFFPRFHLGEVLLSAGLFSSETAGESGIAAFFDISKVLDNLIKDNSSGEEYEYVAFTEGDFVYDFSTEENSKETQKKIDKVIQKLHKNKTVLTVE